jgi:hypothetical protein
MSIINFCKKHISHYEIYSIFQMKIRWLVIGLYEPTVLYI